MWQEDCHAPYFQYNPPLRRSEPEGEEAATEDVDLRELPDLEPEVTYLLSPGGSPEFGGRECEGAPPQNPNKRAAEEDDVESPNI